MSDQQQRDDATGLYYIVKRPAESGDYSMDFRRTLKTGVTIASVVSVSASPAGITVGSGAASGTSIVFSLSGGTDGADYEITGRCIDSTGHTHEDDILIKVRRAGLLP